MLFRSTYRITALEATTVVAFVWYADTRSYRDSQGDEVPQAVVARTQETLHLNKGNVQSNISRLISVDGNQRFRYSDELNVVTTINDVLTISKICDSKPSYEDLI